MCKEVMHCHVPLLESPVEHQHKTQLHQAKASFFHCGTETTHAKVKVDTTIGGVGSSWLTVKARSNRVVTLASFPGIMSVFPAKSPALAGFTPFTGLTVVFLGSLGLITVRIIINPGWRPQRDSLRGVVTACGIFVLSNLLS